MKVGLLGHGVVGSGVSQIIDAHATKQTEQLEITKILVKDKKDIVDQRMTTNIDAILQDASIDIVVECMGGIEPAYTYAMRALEQGKHFVTSNKKMLASHLLDLYTCAKENHVSLHYEASCGGGISWMNNVARTKRIDAINSFEGIFNGTTNYILSCMYSDNKAFVEMLQEAQKKGYAESDPTDDIDGYDVRYKVALSCMQAFDCLVNPIDIPTYGIRNISIEDIQFCKKNGYNVKLIGKAMVQDGNLFTCVIPMFLKQDNVLSSIPLNFNAIASNSKTLGKAMYIGQGAGSLPTAHAVVQDMIDIVLQENMEMPPLRHIEVKSDVYESNYYIRSTNLNTYMDKIEMRFENACITKKITLQELETILAEIQDTSAFIAEVEA